MGVMLRQARDAAGLSQEELAHRLKTKRLPFQELKIMQKTLNYQHENVFQLLWGKRLKVSIAFGIALLIALMASIAISLHSL